MWGGGVCWQFPGESPHQEQFPGHNHQSPARWGRRPTLNPVHYAAVSPMRLAIVKERASLAVCEIKTTALSRKCGQHFDKRSAAMRSTFQQVFLTFRPHRRTFHMCDVLGVDSKAQHSHRVWVFTHINLWVKCGICGRTSGGGLFLHIYELLQAFRLSHYVHFFHADFFFQLISFWIMNEWWMDERW